jgi:dolichol-phosphate mannosyltransferase
VEQEILLIKVLVLIPTYNEAESIANLLNRLQQVRLLNANIYDIDILIIDDGSPDKTVEIVKSLNLAKVKVLQRDSKNGLGPAYLAGFAEGLKADYQYFVEMDADLSHQPEELPELLRNASDKNFVIGTRWMPGGSVVNWPKKRQYGFQVEMAIKANRNGFQITEVPIKFVERENGHSKMSLAIVWEAWAMVTLWALQRIYKRR